MATFYIRNTQRQPGYQVTADNWNELNGDLNELNRRLVFQVPAEAWKPRSGGVIIEPDGTSEDYRVTYPDGATGIATYKIHVPQDYQPNRASPLEIHIVWHAGLSAHSGQVRWAVVVELVQVGASVVSPRTSAAFEMTGNTVDGEDLTVTPIVVPASTLASLPEFHNVLPLRPGDMFRIRIERRGAHVDDTITGPVYMLHVFGRFQASAQTQIT